MQGVAAPAGSLTSCLPGDAPECRRSRVPRSAGTILCFPIKPAGTWWSQPARWGVGMSQRGGRACFKHPVLSRPVQKAASTFCLRTEYSWPRSCLYHEVLEDKALWKTKCCLTTAWLREIFLSTEQTLQVTNIFNGVYYFIIASCYNRQLNHDKQKKQKCDVLEDQICFLYICFVNLHSSTFCFLWWAIIKAWNSCLPTLPSHVNFALGMSLFQTAFLIIVLAWERTPK